MDDIILFFFGPIRMYYAYRRLVWNIVHEPRNEWKRMPALSPSVPLHQEGEE